MWVGRDVMPGKKNAQGESGKREWGMGGDTERGGMKIRKGWDRAGGGGDSLMESVQAREERAISVDTACLHKCVCVWCRWHRFMKAEGHRWSRCCSCRGWWGSRGVGTAADNGINVISVFFTLLVYIYVCVCARARAQHTCLIDVAR